MKKDNTNYIKVKNIQLYPKVQVYTNYTKVKRYKTINKRRCSPLQKCMQHVSDIKYLYAICFLINVCKYRNNISKHCNILTPEFFVIFRKIQLRTSQAHEICRKII